MKATFARGSQGGSVINTSDNVSELTKFLAPYGIHIDTDQCQQLLTHLDLVIKKNQVMNLTRIVDPNEAIIRHVVDSLLLLPSLYGLLLDMNVRFVDIGTGAGFPGIPLGIMTSWNGVLIDSVAKKVKAVAEFIDDLGIGNQLSAQAIRAEELAKAQRSSFDLVTARAVADLGILVEYATPLLKKGGYLAVSKARIPDDEIERGDKTGELVGMRRVSRETYELPQEQGHREIIVFQRKGSCSVKLPRQVGMAKHKPLV